MKIDRYKPEVALRSENRSENIIGLGWSQPKISWSGNWVPSQRLRLDLGSENTRSQTLNQWSVSRALTDPLALQKRIATKTENSEASKVFIRSKKSTLPEDRHRQTQRESP